MLVKMLDLQVLLVVLYTYNKQCLYKKSADLTAKRGKDGNEMAKQKKGENALNGYTTEQAGFLLAGAKMFIKNPDLTRISIQNDSGAIVLERETMSGKPAVHAIGFTADFDEEDEENESDEEEESEEDEKKVIDNVWRWFD